MIRSIFLFLTLLLVSSTVYSLELLCGNSLRKIVESDKLIYVSLNCVPCSKFVKQENQVATNAELPILVFKENEPEKIKKYMLRQDLKNLNCIINKEIKACITEDITPQYIKCII